MRLIRNNSVLACLLWLSGCSTAKQFNAGGGDRQLWRTISSNPVFNNHHTGFALYDPEKQQWLCQYNSDKYFTPASNTKILTLLTSLHVLGDSIETLRYVINGDTLIFQGMGDPSLLFSEFSSNDHSLEILREHKGSLIFQVGEEIVHFGAGWAWDDYPYNYQVEKSDLPLYGNRVKISRDRFGELHVMPDYFADYIEIDTMGQTAVFRDPVANAFVLNDLLLFPNDTLEIPFIVSDYETTRVLSKALNRSVGLLYGDVSRDSYVSVYGASRDTLLKHMMQDSDNFIAEQLLMQCAFYMRGTFETDSAISVAQQMIMRGTPDPLQWVDGSGLSRYNLFTPRSIVWVLDQLRQLQSMEYLTSIFPAGGRSGTIAEWYAADPPYLYAKTGSLRNQHCLSGYLQTDSGKWLIFSFMHNNFTGDSAEIKGEMQKILLMIKEKY